MRRNQTPVARNYLRLSNAVIDKLRKEYKFILIGKNGYDAFVFWGISSGNTAWRQEQNEIPFGAPVYLIAKDHAENTPVYCCIQYSSSLISISRLSGVYETDKHPNSASCIVTIQNQVLMSTKRLLELPSVAAVLDFQLPVTGADSFYRIFASGAKPNFQKGTGEDGYVSEITEQICKNLNSAKFTILFVQSTETSSEIYFARDTKPNTQVLVLKVSYCNDGHVLVNAGFASIDPVQYGWQAVRHQYIMRSWPYADKMPVAKYCEALVITNSNLRLLKKISVGDMVRIVKSNMPAEDDSEYYTDFKIFKANRKRPSFHGSFILGQAHGLWNRIVTAFKKSRFKRLKNKMCAKCRHGNGNTMEIVI